MGQHIKLTCFARVKFEAELAQANFAKSAVDNIQCGNLLGHEKHAFAFGQALGNEIGDGLAFAGARRADEHEVFASCRSHHCRELRRIGGQRAEDLLGRVIDIKSACVGKRHRRLVGLAGRIDQVGYHGRFAQVFGTLRQILPHKIFGEREHRQHDIFADFPTPDVLDGSAYAHPDTSDVQPGVVTRQITLRHAEFELEVLTQHLDERGVKARLVIMRTNREAGSGALSTQRHRQ